MIALKISALQWWGLIIAGFSCAAEAAHSTELAVTGMRSPTFSLFFAVRKSCVLWRRLMSVVVVEVCPWRWSTVHSCQSSCGVVALYHLRYHECLAGLSLTFLSAAQLTS